MSLHPNTKIAKHLSSIGVVVICILAASFARANPYLAKPGEAPVTVYVATCAVSGGFIQLYTALDQNLFEKYGIAVKHVVIRGGTNINLAALGADEVQFLYCAADSTLPGYGRGPGRHAARFAVGRFALRDYRAQGNSHGAGFEREVRSASAASPACPIVC